jgi:hypothetical protein
MSLTNKLQIPTANADGSFAAPVPPPPDSAADALRDAQAQDALLAEQLDAVNELLAKPPRHQFGTCDLRIGGVLGCADSLEDGAGSGRRACPIFGATHTSTVRGIGRYLADSGSTFQFMPTLGPSARAHLTDSASWKRTVVLVTGGGLVYPRAQRCVYHVLCRRDVCAHAPPCAPVLSGLFALLLPVDLSSRFAERFQS